MPQWKRFDAADFYDASKQAPPSNAPKPIKLNADEHTRFTLPSHLPKLPTASQCFELMYPLTLRQRIVLYTNLYAQQKYAERQSRKVPADGGDSEIDDEDADDDEHVGGGGGGGGGDPWSRGGRSFGEVTLEQLNAFIGVVQLMGLVVLPSYTDYWREGTALFNSSIASVFTINHFQLIWRYLHIVDNTKFNAVERKRDPLWKLRPVIDAQTAAFQSNVAIGRFVSVDEDTVPMRGRTPFLTYIVNKPYKWGIKVFKCCCSATAYCYNFVIYTSARQVATTDELTSSSTPLVATASAAAPSPALEETNVSSIAKRTRNNATQLLDFTDMPPYLGTNARFFVLVTQPLLESNKPRVFVADRLYTTVSLVHLVASKGKYFIGTFDHRFVASNMLPPSLMRETLSNVGDFAARYMELSMPESLGRAWMTVYRWQDVKEVLCISTYNLGECVTTERHSKKDGKQENDYVVKRQCPKALQDYNENMGGTDLHNRYAHSIRPRFNIRRWWMAPFLQMLRYAVVNAHIIYNATREEERLRLQHGNATASVSHLRPVSMKDFTLQLATELIGGRTWRRRPATAAAAETAATATAVPQHLPVLSGTKGNCRCGSAECRLRTLWRCTACGLAMCVEHFAIGHGYRPS